MEVQRAARSAAPTVATPTHQVLAALVREHLVAAAVATTKRTLDKEFRGHIDVSAFKAWWPTCEYASEECANTWMRELNLAALRAKQMVDEVAKVK